MNLSESIQFNRKKLNISQEELGKMLYVSRQTVSMWENGQTAPTIDNLVRLSEIFSVTVDDLLKGEINLKDNEAKESYEFNFENDELKEIKNHLASPIFIRIIKIFAFTLIVLLFLLASDSPKETIFLGIGALLIALASNLKALFIFKKSWKDSFDKIINSIYKYEIYEDKLELNILRDGDLIQNSFKYSDIENIRNLRNYYLIQISNQLFILRKSDLAENSIFYTFLFKNPSKVLDETVSPKLKIASFILLVFSICSIFFAIILTGYLSEKNNLFVENTWLFFIMTPIPISSIIFGVVSKKKGYKFKKNTVVGIIMTILLCLYGSFVFVF